MSAADTARTGALRVQMGAGVAYGSDVDQVVEMLEEMAREHGSVCRVPHLRVRMRGFGDSSLDFELLCSIDHPSGRGRVAHELYMEIYRALDRHEARIPLFAARPLGSGSAPAAGLTLWVHRSSEGQ